MRVRLTTDRAAASGLQLSGEVIEVIDIEGQRLLVSGQAEPVTEVETMTQTPPERAMRTKFKRR